MYDAPTRTLYYDLIQDSSYSSTFEHENGTFQEEKTLESLSKIVGKGNVYGPLRYGAKKEFETDGLVIFDDRVIVIESKSKRLTAQARLGNYEDIVNDFSSAVESAYEQGLRARSFILSNSNAEFEMLDGTKVSIQRKDVAEIYVVCVTSESYGAMMMNVDKLLAKQKDDPFPWVVSVVDLDLVSDYFPNPYLFFHFLGRRLKCYGRVNSANELDYVANYLTRGLYFEDELRSADFVMLVGFAREFDVENLKPRGAKFGNPITPQPSPIEFADLLKTIGALDGPGHASIMLTLLDLDQQTRQKLIETITKVTSLTHSDGKRHDFTMAFDDFGISFLSMFNRDELRETVVRLGHLKKYKHKKRKWLSLGRAVEDSRYLVNEYCLLDFDWKYDGELEKLAKYLR